MAVSNMKPSKLASGNLDNWVEVWAVNLMGWKGSMVLVMGWAGFGLPNCEVFKGPSFAILLPLTFA